MVLLLVVLQGVPIIDRTALITSKDYTFSHIFIGTTIQLKLTNHSSFVIQDTVTTTKDSTQSKKSSKVLQFYLDA